MTIDWSDHHVWLVSIGMVLGLQNYAYYIYKTAKGVFKPHLFSWGIWALLGAIVFAAQWTKDAGPGMWQTFTMVIGLTAITALAVFKGDKNYTRSDWWALSTALLAIPLWILTKDPLWSVILVTIIDVVATWPTIRKAYVRPHEESARAFFTAAIVCSMGFLALTNLTLTTGLYTGTIAILNYLTTALILMRRRAIPAEAT